jgi:L-threonine kinase
MNQRTGSLVRTYRWWPEYWLVMVVPAGAVNTEDVDFKGKKLLTKEYDEILYQVDKASEARDEKRFAQAATRSAILNQAYLKNPCFTELHNMYEDLGALGINVAHTGVVAAMIFSAKDDGYLKAIAASQRITKVLSPEYGVIVTKVEPSRPWLKMEN